MKFRTAVMAVTLMVSSGSVPERDPEYEMRVDCKNHPNGMDIVGLEELGSVLGDPAPYLENYRIGLADRNTVTTINVRVSRIGAVSINGRPLSDNDAGLPLVHVGEKATLIGGIPTSESNESSKIYEAAGTAATLACVSYDQS